MSENEKNSIISLRAQGEDYKSIAAKLGLSANTVKSFCRRNSAQYQCGSIALIQGKACLQCAEPIKSRVIRNNRKFCCEKFRRERWKANDEKINKTAYYSFTCFHCGKTFESYGNKTCKYCCHTCYIKARYQ